LYQVAILHRNQEILLQTLKNHGSAVCDFWYHIGVRWVDHYFLAINLSLVLSYPKVYGLSFIDYIHTPINWIPFHLPPMLQQQLLWKQGTAILYNWWCIQGFSLIIHLELRFSDLKFNKIERYQFDGYELPSFHFYIIQNFSARDHCDYVRTCDQWNVCFELSTTVYWDAFSVYFDQIASFCLSAQYEYRVWFEYVLGNGVFFRSIQC